MDPVTVHKQSDRIPADLEQDFVPQVIEKGIDLAENNGLIPGVQRGESKLHRLGFTVQPYSQLLVPIGSLQLPDIPVFIDSAATHAQHGHKREHLGQS